MIIFISLRNLNNVTCVKFILNNLKPFPILVTCLDMCVKEWLSKQMSMQLDFLWFNCSSELVPDAQDVNILGWVRQYQDDKINLERIYNVK